MGKMKFGSYLALVSLAALAACGGGGGDDITSMAQARANAADAMIDRVIAQAPTISMPTSGSANYNGHFLGAIDRGVQDDLLLLGDLEVTADFGSGQISGSADNFVSTSADNSVSSVAEVVPNGVTAMDGSLSFTDSVIIGNEFLVQAEGTLRGGGNTVVVDNTAIGEFTGPNASGLIFATTPGDRILLNGLSSSGTLGGVAER